MSGKHVCTQNEWDDFPRRLTLGNAYMIGWRPRTFATDTTIVLSHHRMGGPSVWKFMLDRLCNGRGWCDHGGVVRVERA